MVTISVRKKDFLKLVGKHVSDKELEETLPLIKCAVEGITEEEMALEITGDRPDLLSSEGVARALKGFLGMEKGAPKLRLKKSGMKIMVERSVEPVRPFVVSAVVKGIEITGGYIKGLMQLQEKLHLTHGRKRRKVAIGIHNLDVLTGDFVYKAVLPEEIEFVPLGKHTKMNLKEILEKHEKGREYAFTLEGKQLYPIILDGKGEVVSFPPIINNSLTVVTEETRNFFLDLTGENFDAVNVALNILCHDFQDRGASIESVEVIYPNNRIIETPVVKETAMRVGFEEANKMLGIHLKALEMVELLKKQRIDAVAEGGWVNTKIPCYRGDFLHPVDLIEEIAIGYGFNNFEPLAPRIFTKGSASTLTVLVNKARDLAIGAGFLETHTYVITNENTLRKAKTSEKPVIISNPVSLDLNCLRPRITPILLEALSKNTHNDYPQRVFEAGEVVVLKEGTETETQTQFNLAAVSAHAEANFSEIVSALDAIMKGLRRKYELKKTKKERFIEGRCAEIIEGGRVGGEVGEVHPLVLKEFGLTMPCASFEFKLKEVE
ncbi:phenylalanine--tRNA ligase subunit beta [Candidatus Micrarchaeota archaeon]|nr:phenylalanine--tRNA ligase subunit beta [Candidatus Micrarchaeota archaeon]